jgi:hypothetical protein
VIPGIDQEYEICAIAFLSTGKGGYSGHFFTYIKYQNGWLDLDCLGMHRLEKVTARNCFVNNDFLRTLKVPTGNYDDKGEMKFAYACMLMLKAK